MDVQEVIQELQKLADPAVKSGMSKFGINNSKALGVKIPFVRALAKKLKKNHALAISLWETDVHEAQILATIIANPLETTSELMDGWVASIGTWDLCDQACSNLFVKTPYAYEKALTWAQEKEEFIKRAGFSMMAALAVHDKNAPEDKLLNFFPYILSGAVDSRNFVKKAVNWALRQIGKKNLTLNEKALDLARELVKQPSSTARWIALDAIKELESPKVVEALKSRKI